MEMCVVLTGCAESVGWPGVNRQVRTLPSILHNGAVMVGHRPHVFQLRQQQKDFDDKCDSVQWYHVPYR